VARRLNPITGEWEDDQMLVDTSVDLNKAGIDSAAAMERASKAIQPGEYLASGPATPGKALTNSPAAAAVVNPDIQRLQQQVARQQADVLKAQAGGATPPQEMQEARDSIKKLEIPPAQSGQKPALPVDSKMSKESRYNEFSMAVSSGRGEVPDPGDARNAYIDILAKQKGQKDLLTRRDAIISDIGAKIEDLKKENPFKYTTREDFLSDVDKMAVPESYRKIARRMALDSLPALTQAREVGMLEGAKESAKEGETRTAKIQTLKETGAVMLEQKAREFEQTLALNKKGDVAMFKEQLTGMTPGWSDEDRKRLSVYQETGDRTGLTDNTVRLYDEKIADWKASRTTEYREGREQDVPRDVLDARRQARKAASANRLPFSISGEPDGSAAVSRNAAKAGASPEVISASQKNSERIDSVAATYGVSSFGANVMKQTSGMTQADANEYSDEAIGIDPKSRFSGAAVPMSTDKLAQDAKAVSTIMRDAINRGQSIYDQEVKRKIGSVFSASKTPDEKRIRAGSAVFEAMIGLRQAGEAEWQQAMEKAKTQVTGQAAEMVGMLIDDVVGQAASPIMQAAAIRDFMLAAAPTDTAGKKMELPAITTASEREQLKREPWRFVQSLMAQLEADQRRDPNMVIAYRQVLEGGTSREGWNEFARRNPAFAVAAQSVMNSYVGNMSVVEDKVRLAFDGKYGKGRFDGFVTSGGAVHVPDLAKPESAIFFARNSDKIAYEAIGGDDKNSQEAKDKREFLLAMLKSPTGIYGQSDASFVTGKSSMAGDATAAVFSGDSNYFASRGRSGNDYALAVKEEVRKAIAPEVTKDKETKQPAAAVFRPYFAGKASEENATKVSAKTISMFKEGYELYKKNDPDGIPLMEAAHHAANMELQEAAARNVKDRGDQIAAMLKPTVIQMRNEMGAVRWEQGQVQELKPMDLAGMLDTIRKYAEFNIILTDEDLLRKRFPDLDYELSKIYSLFQEPTLDGMIGKLSVSSNKSGSPAMKKWVYEQSKLVALAKEIRRSISAEKVERFDTPIVLPIPVVIR